MKFIELWSAFFCSEFCSILSTDNAFFYWGWGAGNRHQKHIKHLCGITNIKMYNPSEILFEYYSMNFRAENFYLTNYKYITYL